MDDISIHLNVETDIEDIYIERIKHLEQQIKELKGETDEPEMFFPEYKDPRAVLQYSNGILKITYAAFDGTHTYELDPFKNHNVPDFIAGAINYFRWDNALYDDNDYSDEIDLEDEKVRYLNFKGLP